MIARYYYDPILGLQYSLEPFPVISIDVAMIPKNFDINKVMEFLKRDRLMIINSKQSALSSIKWPVVIYNHVQAVLDWMEELKLRLYTGSTCENCLEPVNDGWVRWLEHQKKCEFKAVEYDNDITLTTAP